jgi:hypothetical protein
MAFGPLEIVNGIFSWIIILTYSLVGLRIAWIYRKSKDKAHLLIGISWMGLVSPWYGSGVSFLIALFNNGQGLLSIPQVYFLLVIPYIAVDSVVMVSGITEIMFREHQNKIRLAFIIHSITWEILFAVFLLSLPLDLLIDLVSPVNASYGVVSTIFILINLVIFAFIGIFLARSSIRLGTTENKAKGYFLITAFTLFIVGAILDSVLEIEDLSALLIPRLILIAGGLIFYLGFITPNFIKKRLK